MYADIGIILQSCDKHTMHACIRVFKRLGCLVAYLDFFLPKAILIDVHMQYPVLLLFLGIKFFFRAILLRIRHKNINDA